MSHKQTLLEIKYYFVNLEILILIGVKRSSRATEAPLDAWVGVDRYRYDSPSAITPIARLVRATAGAYATHIPTNSVRHLTEPLVTEYLKAREQ